MSEYTVNPNDFEDVNAIQRTIELPTQFHNRDFTLRNKSDKEKK